MCDNFSVRQILQAIGQFEIRVRPMNRKQRRAAAKLGSPATNLLATAARLHQAGQLVAAEACYRQALAAQPNLAEGHFRLGDALMGQGKSDEAVAAYRQAISIKPDFAEPHSNLGNALTGQGKLDEAIAAYRQAISIKPTLAEPHCNLGGALAAQGKLDEAVAAYRRAIGIKSDFAGAHSNLALVLIGQGKFDEAIAACRRAIGLKPDFAAAHFTLGDALSGQGKLDEAVAAYRQAIRIGHPNIASIHCNLGNALMGQGKSDDAVAAYRQAISIKPAFAEAHSNLGIALFAQGKFDEAVAAYRQAISIKPDFAEAHSNLGTALTGQGKLVEAVAAYRQAIGIKPDFSKALSGLLLCLNYDDQLTNDHLFAAHREWDERYGQRAPTFTTYENDRDATRRLRIGYLSPDFREHSVAYFVEPLLRGHDRHKVQVFCYAEMTRPDSGTTRLQGLADHWLVTVGLSDQRLAERIRTDGIDILVDVAGHTAGNRLLVFARKPAPVQVTWLGYPNTTGLKAIDYRLVDAVTDPAGEADAWASETLVRLKDGFLCYRGLEDGPEPAPPPCLKTGTVTFGSFNNPAKVSMATFDAWAKLLSRLPQARLILKGISFADAATRASFFARLGDRGVAADRVELVTRLPGVAEHLALYHRVDIALDPFPFNGTTTTCEALWMGVPVITLRGHRHAGRVGASLLSQVGLTDFIADSIEEYVEIAIGLAANPGRLAELHRLLRSRVAASPLCDEGAFAFKMEAAFRTMWQRWCQGFPQ
jgi:predicted O-linked N-acetylglucosamine transferase (SPINDLY family)